MSYSKCPTLPASTGGRLLALLVLTLAWVSTAVPLAAQSGATVAVDPGLPAGPTFRDMLSLRSVGSPAISPGPLKQRLGGLWHNWQWFLKYIWDEDIEIPLDIPSTEDGQPQGR